MMAELDGEFGGRRLQDDSELQKKKKFKESIEELNLGQ